MLATGQPNIFMMLRGVGDTVTRGQVLGAVGSTGQSTGAHLHFGILVDGGIVDLSARTNGRWTGLRDVIAAKALDELRAALKGAAHPGTHPYGTLAPPSPPPRRSPAVRFVFDSYQRLSYKRQQPK